MGEIGLVPPVEYEATYRSTTLLEQPAQREFEVSIKPVLDTFPNPAALLRLAGHVLIEQRDERDGAERRYSSEHSMTLFTVSEEEVAIPEIAAA
jgi:hypothetical protein